MAGACVLDNCCFCIDLRVGALIIGYLELVGNFILAILVGISIAAGSVLVAHSDEIKQSEELKGLDVQAMGGLFLALGIFLLIVLIVNLTFTIILLVGVHNERRGHVKAFLIFNMICIVLMVISFLASFSGPVNVGSIFQNLFSILLSVYFWICIRSHWIKMGEVSKNPPHYTA